MNIPHRGFTLVELLISTAALALLLGFALPSVTGAMEAARSADARAELLSSLTAANHRAAFTGTRAVLCPSLNGESCTPGYDWSRGWIAFSDVDGDRERDSEDRLVQASPALRGEVRLTSSPGRTRIVFQPSGGNAGSNVTFTLCDGRGPAKAVSLIMNNMGRLRDQPASAAAAMQACSE